MARTLGCLLLVFSLMALLNCGSEEATVPEPTALLEPDASLSTATSIAFTEGPAADAEGNVYFSEIRGNRILKYSPDGAWSEFRNPSRRANGLAFDAQGRLIACEGADVGGGRQVTRTDLSTGKVEVLADRYEGKRLNSPNDLVYRSTGDLFFTDPAYGLPGRYEDTANRELDFCGVFHLSPSGDLNLLTDELTNPNGLAFSVDESILYVGQSNRERAIWMAYLVRPDGSIDKGEVFCDVTELAGGELPGAPDGFKLDAKGNMFATGPGGVYVISAGGKILGRIDPGKQSANVAWGDDGSMLYITAHSCLCRIQTLTTAAVMP